MIAVCDVGPPAAVHRPSTIAGSSLAVSDGDRSSATRMTGESSTPGSSSSVSANRRNTRRPTSWRSTARSLSSASPRLATSRARSSNVSRHDQPALCPPFIRSSAVSTRSGSSRNSSCARKMAARAAPLLSLTSSWSSRNCTLAASIDCRKRISSRAGSLAVTATTIFSRRKWRKGPIARPGEAEIPAIALPESVRMGPLPASGAA
jgi:hypothetical protein